MVYPRKKVNWYAYMEKLINKNYNNTKGKLVLQYSKKEKQTARNKKIQITKLIKTKDFDE